MLDNLDQPPRLVSPPLAHDRVEQISLQTPAYPLEANAVLLPRPLGAARDLEKDAVGLVCSEIILSREDRAVGRDELGGLRLGGRLVAAKAKGERVAFLVGHLAQDGGSGGWAWRSSCVRCLPVACVLSSSNSPVTCWPSRSWVAIVELNAALTTLPAAAFHRSAVAFSIN